MALRDKKLALAFQFSEAHDDVKLIAQEHADNALRLDKAQHQLDLWTKEFDQARSAYAASNSKFEKALDRWLSQKPDVREELPE